MQSEYRSVPDAWGSEKALVMKFSCGFSSVSIAHTAKLRNQPKEDTLLCDWEV